jgi:MoaA/NifB/PqqE/SkfB family radical SAM enzyme
MKAKPYQALFAGHIDVSLETAANILSVYPASGAAFLRLSESSKKAQRNRGRYTKAGLEIPPLMIVSTTELCNLACAGCYAGANKRKSENALSDGRIFEILDEASGLGVSIVMLAGGEPLLSHGWMDALALHTEMVGVVFTNGTLFDESRVDWFSRYRHIFPVFSIEGNELQTDTRRGMGVYAMVDHAMTALQKAGVPCGISMTATSKNIDSILGNEFTEEYLEKGCRLFVFPEYVPAEPGTQPMVLSKDNKQKLGEFAAQSAKRYPALFIPFPGDEEEYGGCLAAGRGFVHISASGDIEPCPFAPFSDTNLKNTSLATALQSDFLSKVRENHHLLKEGDGGCALWNNRAWCDAAVKSNS